MLLYSAYIYTFSDDGKYFRELEEKFKEHMDGGYKGRAIIKNFQASTGCCGLNGTGISVELGCWKDYKPFFSQHVPVSCPLYLVNLEVKLRYECVITTGYWIFVVLLGLCIYQTRKDKAAFRASQSNVTQPNPLRPIYIQPPFVPNYPLLPQASYQPTPDQAHQSADTKSRFA